MDLKLLLTKLTKQQKEELIRLLSTETMDSSTDKVIYCPKCGSFHLVKNGKNKGHQYFICKDCGKTFVEYKNTIFSSTKKDILLWKSYIKMMFEGYSIKQIANKLNICIQTSFRWRHKILSVLENKFMNDTLKGIVEIDETFLLESHKGIKIENDSKKLSVSVAFQTSKLVYWLQLTEIIMSFHKNMDLVKFKRKMSETF